MNWSLRYRLLQNSRSSLVMWSAMALLAALVCSMLMRQIDAALGWRIFNFTPNGARAVLATFVGSMFTFIVFVLTATLIVVQLASGQFTPRVIGVVFMQHGIKLTLAALTFTFTFTLAALARVEEGAVHDLFVGVAVILNLLCILGFFYFAQELSRGLRPSSLVQQVALYGRDVIRQVYTLPYDAARPEQGGSAIAEVPFDKTVNYHGDSGIVLAFSAPHLVRIAEQAGVIIQLIPQVGDFVAKGDPLFRLTAGGPVTESQLLNCVALGPERTFEQDPRFIFRILADIANKALSPAINDPTTAVVALDQIHDLLLRIGRRHLGDGLMRDDRGNLRLVFGTPDWPDFVMLAASEIRQFGQSSLQVNRRLEAMLEHLIEVLPESRKPALKLELRMLQDSAVRMFVDHEDQRRALMPDYQGLGGSHRVEADETVDD